MSKKKISIITIHSIYNYGSALQSYATQCFLEKLGYDAELIDYRPDYDKTFIRKIKNCGIKLLFPKTYFIRARKYFKFHKNNMNLSKRKYKNYKELCNNPPKADIYLSGSDQIWNTYFPCGKDRAYTLEFIKNEKKIAYSSSIGRDDMSIDDLKQLAERIKDYKWISMREKSGVRQLAKVGVEAVDVCDPVFLLSADYYKKIQVKPNIGKYILVYSVHQSPDLSEIVQLIKKKLGLNVVLVGDIPIKCYHDISKKDSGPLEFIGLINGAEYIITNSFHCVAFSLILQKQFLPVAPKVNASRVTNILEIGKIQDILVETVKDLPEKLINIDYEKVSFYINEYAKQSAEKLKNALMSIE